LEVSTTNVVHADAAPVGSVVVTMSVATSSATQRLVLAHVRAARGALLSTPVVAVRRVVDRRWMPLPPSGGRDDHG
jgi:hypothetical protein